ncbi:MAG TPA: DedA family protein [Thermosynechococcaceae cyanobacterium]
MVEWITTTMNSLGYWGIGLLMFLENLFPPIPSELIMPLAGFTASQGKMDFWLAVLAGTIGTVLGALPWYYAGKLLSQKRLKRWADRYGKWAGVSGQDIDKSNSWFQRHGAKAVLFCRLVPGVRTLISLPAGINAMPLAQFLVYSTIGTALWTIFLTALGYFLGKNYTLVDNYLGPVSKFVILGIGAVLAIWLFRKIQQKRRQGVGDR